MKRIVVFITLLAASLAPAPGIKDLPPKQLPPAHIRTDEEIKRAVIKAIVVIRKASAANLRVSVKNGVVTLDGTAPDAEAKAMAEKIARSVSGVQSVRSRLTLRPAARSGADR